MKLSLIIVLFAVTVVAGFGQLQSPVAVPAPYNGNSSPSAALPANYQLHLQGTSGKETFLDITLTGIGPAYSVQTPEELATAFQATVAKRDDKIAITYNIAQTVKTIANNATEYKTSTLSGSAELTLSQPVTIAKINGRTYTLEILPPDSKRD